MFDNGRVQMFHFHKWTDWSIIERGLIVDKVHAERRTYGHYLVQERFCMTCKKTQLNHNRTIVTSPTCAADMVTKPQTHAIKLKHDKVA